MPHTCVVPYTSGCSPAHAEGPLLQAALSMADALWYVLYTIHLTTILLLLYGYYSTLYTLLLYYLLFMYYVVIHQLWLCITGVYMVCIVTI